MQIDCTVILGCCPLTLDLLLTESGNNLYSVWLAGLNKVNRIWHLSVWRRGTFGFFTKLVVLVLFRDAHWNWMTKQHRKNSKASWRDTTYPPHLNGSQSGWSRRCQHVKKWCWKLKMWSFITHALTGPYNNSTRLLYYRNLFYSAILNDLFLLTQMWSASIRLASTSVWSMMWRDVSLSTASPLRRPRWEKHVFHSHTLSSDSWLLIFTCPVFFLIGLPFLRSTSCVRWRRSSLAPKESLTWWPMTPAPSVTPTLWSRPTTRFALTSRLARSQISSNSILVGPSHLRKHNVRVILALTDFPTLSS